MKFQKSKMAGRRYARETRSVSSWDSAIFRFWRRRLYCSELKCNEVLLAMVTAYHWPVCELAGDIRRGAFVINHKSSWDEYCGAPWATIIKDKLPRRFPQCRLDALDNSRPVVVGNVGDHSVSSYRLYVSKTQQQADATPTRYLCGVAYGQPSTSDGPTCNMP